jgi:hypothetical protein
MSTSVGRVWFPAVMGGTAGLCWLVNQVIMRPAILVFALASASSVFALPQATQTPAPGSEKPSVYVGGDNPNRQERTDKSRLRDVKGAVRDENEDPIEGAIVKIRNLGTGKSIAWRTGKDGSYLFRDMNMDTDYELTVTHDSFREPVVRKLSQYDTRKPATINLHLQRKKAAEAASTGH